MSRHSKRKSRSVAREAKRNPHMAIRLNKRRSATKARVFCDPRMPEGWEFGAVR